MGMAGVSMGPVVGHIIDRLIPWYASLFSILTLLCFQSIQLGAGGVNIAAVIIAAFGLDIFRQMLQVSLTTAVFGFVVHFLNVPLHLTTSLSQNFCSCSSSTKCHINFIGMYTVSKSFGHDLNKTSGRYLLAKSWALP